LNMDSDEIPLASPRSFLFPQSFWRWRLEV
jgi:hypothetical protein